VHIKKKSQFLELMQEEKVKASRLAKYEANLYEDEQDAQEERKTENGRMNDILHDRFD